VLTLRGAGWCQVNIPKTKKSYCKGKQCKKHQVHKVTQYKTGKASLYAQGASCSPSSALSAAPALPGGHGCPQGLCPSAHLCCAMVAATQTERLVANRTDDYNSCRGGGGWCGESTGELMELCTCNREAALRPQAERLRWSDQACVPQEGTRVVFRVPRPLLVRRSQRPHSASLIEQAPHDSTDGANAPSSSPAAIQAKTTKKIVLRLQCQSCRQVSQHPIKVRASPSCWRLALRANPAPCCTAGTRAAR
jgi:ribosomal protein L44E